MNIMELLTLSGIAVTTLIFAAGVIRSLWVKVTTNHDDLTEFKLEVAEKYAGVHQIHLMKEDMRRSEERLNVSLVALTARIDRVLTRMEK